MKILCRFFGHEEFRLRPVSNHEHVMGLTCTRSRCRWMVRFEGPYLHNPKDVAKWEKSVESMKPGPSYNELKGQRDALLQALEIAKAA